MIIVIEGLDRCGKDSTINYIRQNYLISPNIMTIGSSKPYLKAKDHTAWAKESFNTILTMLLCAKKNNINVILNRSWIGEYIYGPLYRKANPEWILDFENNLLNLLGDVKVLLIMLTDLGKNIVNRDDGKSLAIDEKQFNIERLLFHEYFKKTHIKNKILIDLKPNIESTLSDVEHFMNKNIIKEKVNENI